MPGRSGLGIAWKKWGNAWEKWVRECLWEVGWGLPGRS